VATRWVRENSKRLVLVAAGVAILVLAFLLRDQQGLAIALAFLGGGLFFVGIVLPEASLVRIGTTGFEAQLGRIEQKVDTLPTRTALADYIQQGDHIANALRLAKQMVEYNLQRREPLDYDETVWDQVLIWQRDVENYLRASPQLGDPDAKLFMSQVEDVGTSIRLPERFDGEIAIVRGRQRRLREMVKRFE
jgi:hypothetical protein